MDMIVMISSLSYICLVVGKKVSKAPKIQRLVTPLTLQRKRARIADKKKRIAKAKSEAAEYQKLLASKKISLGIWNILIYSEGVYNS